MSDLLPYSPGGLTVSGDARRAARTISRHQAHAQVRVSAVDVDTDVAMAKIDALTQATGSAMGAVVRVAQAQTQLEQLAPAASGRLNYLAEAHTHAMGDIMTDLHRDTRRR